MVENAQTADSSEHNVRVTSAHSNFANTPDLTSSSSILFGGWQTSFCCVTATFRNGGWITNMQPH